MRRLGTGLEEIRFRLRFRLLDLEGKEDQVAHLQGRQLEQIDGIPINYLRVCGIEVLPLPLLQHLLRQRRKRRLLIQTFFLEQRDTNLLPLLLKIHLLEYLAAAHLPQRSILEFLHRMPERNLATARLPRLLPQKRSILEFLYGMRERNLAAAHL